MIERGVLKSYLLNTYAGRKMGMKTTGNASRGLTGNAGIGHGNFFIEKGVQTPERILAGIPNGFYVTELMGFGVNITTGDFSQGAGGHWIENGELTYPVTEINVSGNLRDMLQDIEMVGNDLFFRGSSGAPTLLMAKLHHPYAVTLFDASLNDPQGPCIVMEYIKGIPLEDLLQANKGRMNPARVGRMLGQICEVLQAAHHQGGCRKPKQPKRYRTRHRSQGDAQTVWEGVPRWLLRRIADDSSVARSDPLVTVNG